MSEPDFRRVEKYYPSVGRDTAGRNTNMIEIFIVYQRRHKKYVLNLE